jgi:hypothetical protein
MWLFNQPSTAARTALVYITVGALTVIWTGVWALYLYNNPPHTPTVHYICAGFLVTGLALMGIGFGVGHIGRAARNADLPPQEIAEMTPTVTTTTPAVTTTAAPAVNVPTKTAAPNSPVPPPVQVSQASRPKVVT